MSPIIITASRPDGSTIILSAQIGYISDIPGASKEITILERSKFYPNNTKLGIEVGTYRCTIIRENRYVMISTTGGEYRPIVEIYTSFYSGVKAALLDFCRSNHYTIVENLTKKKG